MNNRLVNKPKNIQKKGNNKTISTTGHHKRLRSHFTD